MILLFTVYLILLFISPIIGVFLSFFVIFYAHKNKYFVQLSLLNLAAFLGLINVLKVPESDLINYIHTYNLAGETGWLSFLLLFQKEPLFYLFTKVVNYITSGNEALYIISFTALGYYILFYALWKVHTYYKLSINNFIIAILCAFLFPNLFALSAHLVRQFIASSLIILFLVNNFYWNKKSIGLLFVAFLFHSTSLIFAVCLLPLFANRMTLKRSILFLITSLGLLVVGNKLISIMFAVLSQIPLLSYAIGRVAEADEAKAEPLGMSILVFHIVIIVLFFLISRIKKINNLTNNNFRFFYLSFLLFVYILLNRNNGIISLRFSFYMYFLLPLSFYFIVELVSTRVVKILVQICVFIIFVLWFVYKINNGFWTYNDVDKLFI